MSDRGNTSACAARIWGITVWTGATLPSNDIHNLVSTVESLMSTVVGATVSVDRVEYCARPDLSPAVIITHVTCYAPPLAPPPPPAAAAPPPPPTSSLAALQMHAAATEVISVIAIVNVLIAPGFLVGPATSAFAVTSYSRNGLQYSLPLFSSSAPREYGCPDSLIGGVATPVYPVQPTAPPATTPASFPGPPSSSSPAAAGKEQWGVVVIMVLVLPLAVAGMLLFVD